jgi:signal peptidase I
MIPAGASALVVLAAALVWLRRRYVVVTVHGASMRPTYREGDRVLIRRVPITAVRPGQVVVVSSTPPETALSDDVSQWLIKRAIAVPGDPVPRERFPALRVVADTAVPPGHLVVLGDNPERSFDSRQAGYVTPGRLLGVVTRRLGRDAAPSHPPPEGSG